MKPFLLLSTRHHDGAATAEHVSVSRHAGLDPQDVVQLRLEAAPVRGIDLDAFSGIILGGSPFNVSDPDKSVVQLRVESDLRRLLDDILSNDRPFMGLCYGIGMVTTHLGGVVDRTHGEPAGPVTIAVTEVGQADPLFEGVPSTFDAFVGHKESGNGLPGGVELLATSESCPVQMYRVGENVYVTQFHPELDPDEFADRMRVYQHNGYFRPEELDDVIALAKTSGVDGSQHRLLRNFARRYSAY
ncbi:MAG: glutamine amidotransferase [Brooklawnia sp.]|uniref:glutamine amidotransferase n=1 Tax=Brooklawnia sp. TaxID=2699740 RepID=UPI003C779845